MTQKCQTLLRAIIYGGTQDIYIFTDSYACGDLGTKSLSWR